MDVKKEAKKSPNRSKKSGDRKAFAYEFNRICFASQADFFRATVSSVAEGVLIWLESKKTKQQWQATITNVGECGPSGVPEEAVVAFLKKAFELILDSDENLETERDDPKVDFILEEEDIYLMLTLSMGGVWKPEFVFNLLPVGLDKIDILEAKLRDAQDEIEALKIELNEKSDKSEISFLSLSSITSCPNQQMVQWNGTVPRVITAETYSVSTDNRQVTVLKRGVYQVQIRLSGTSNTNTAHMGLQVNGADIAQCIQSDGNNHQNSPQIFEILRLNVNDILQVRCGANGYSLEVALANRFTILYLGV